MKFFSVISWLVSLVGVLFLVSCEPAQRAPDDGETRLLPDTAALPSNPAGEEEMWDRIAANLRELFAGEEKSTALPLERILPLLDADGSFSDILLPKGIVAGANRREGGEAPERETRRHLERAMLLARAYSDPQSSLHNDPVLQVTLPKVFQAWLEADPDSRNWYWRQISYPTYLARAALVFEPELRARHPELLQDIAAYLLWSLDGGKQNMQGSNGLDVAFIGLASAVFSRDPALLQRARQWTVELLETRNPVPHPELLERSRQHGYNSLAEEEKNQLLETEGIQPDGAFHQHNLYGRQLYLGEYGANFLEKASWSVYGLKGTPHAFTEEELAAVTDCFDHNVQWIHYRGRIDPGQLGRYNGPGFFQSKDGVPERDRALLLLSAARRLAAPEIPGHERLQAVVDRLENPEANPLVGNRMYYTSDYMVHRRPGFFASCRMTSDRSVGNEAGHNLGRWNYHTGDGVLLVLAGGKEYEGWSTEFDGRHLPGTTVLQSPETLPEVNWGRQNWGGDSFAGGTSDGEFGVAGFRQNKAGVRARKGYFFLGDTILVLGDGVTSSQAHPVHTSLEWAPAPITLPANPAVGQPFPLENRWFALLEMDEQTKPEVVNSPDPHGQSSALVLNHGAAPSAGRFAYGVWPAGSEEETRRRLNTLRVAMESPGLLVEDSENSLVAVIAFEAGSFLLSDGTRLAVSDPCFLLINNKTDGEPTISAAVPGDGIARQLTIQLFGPSAEHAAFEAVLDMPGGPASGITVQSRFPRNSPANPPNQSGRNPGKGKDGQEVSGHGTRAGKRFPVNIAERIAFWHAVDSSGHTADSLSPWKHQGLF